MSKNKVFIVGCRNPVFVVDSADIFKRLGWEVEIVFRTSFYPISDYNGHKVTATISKESIFFRLLLAFLARMLSFIERIQLKLKKNQTKVLSSNNIIQSWSVASYINKSNAQLVYVHAAYDFVVINRFLNNKIKTINMPWGADIYEYAHESDIIFQMVKKGLNQFDLVAPASVAAAKYVEETFEIDSSKTYANKYLITGQKEILELKSDNPSIDEIRNRYKIPTDSKVLINIRRLKPKWGSKEFLKTALTLAAQDEKYFFIAISGTGAEEEYEMYQDSIKKSGVENQFLIINESLSLMEYLKLLFISDVALSLMHSGDMRSASIMSAFALKLPLILSKQNEYYELQNEGFGFIMVDYNNAEEIRDACLDYIVYPERTADMALRNEKMILENYYPERGIKEMIEQVGL